MVEKQGQTEKLIYDFSTTACCEVQLPNGDWCRITPREFRSCNRRRRLSYLDNDVYIIKEYNGDLYYFNTNILVNESDIIKEGIQFIGGVDLRNSSTGKSFGRI